MYLTILERFSSDNPLLCFAHRAQAWRQGQTGYPLVDAAMKQLWSTGWAHNRLRIVASSFMVKNLLLPWQWGLKHFWDAQLDAGETRFSNWDNDCSFM